MIADAGGKLVIVGHSERRADHGETDAVVRAKAEAAWRAGLARHPVHRRDRGRTTRRPDRRRAQPADRRLGAGRGNAPTSWSSPTSRSGRSAPGSRHRMMTLSPPMPIYGRGWRSASVRSRRDAIRILYGGSVKPDNADEPSWRLTASTVPWSAAPASKRRISLRLSPPAGESPRPGGGSGAVRPDRVQGAQTSNIG